MNLITAIILTWFFSMAVNMWIIFDVLKNSSEDKVTPLQFVAMIVFGFLFGPIFMILMIVITLLNFKDEEDELEKEREHGDEPTE